MSDERPTASGGSKHNRHLSNYLIDSSLQLRYIVFVTVLSVLICGSLGTLILRQESRASDSIMETMRELPGDWTEIDAAVEAKLSGDDSTLVLKMGAIAIALVLILSVYLLVMTHKVAGPLYKISGYFDRMTEGRLGDIWPLRKGDMLQDFYGQFKEMHDAVRDRFLSDDRQVARFIETCEASGATRDEDLAAAVATLREHHLKRQQMLARD